VNILEVSSGFLKPFMTYQNIMLIRSVWTNVADGKHDAFDDTKV